MSGDEVRFQLSLFFSSSFGFNSRILSWKLCSLPFFFRLANGNWKTKKKKWVESTEYVALLNRVDEIVAHREEEAEKKAMQKEKEKDMTKKEAEEGFEEGEEEEEEEEFAREQQPTSNPTTPGVGKGERKTKKRKQ